MQQFLTFDAVDDANVPKETLNVLQIVSETPNELAEQCAHVLEQWQRGANNEPQTLARALLEMNLSTSKIASLTLVESPQLRGGDAAATATAVTVTPHVVDCIVRQKLPPISDRYVFENQNVCLHTSSCVTMYQLSVASGAIFVSNHFEDDTRRGDARTLPAGHVDIERLVVVPIALPALPIGRLVFANAAHDYTLADVKRMLQCAYILWPHIVMRMLTRFCAQRLEAEKDLSRQQVHMTQQLEAAKDAFFATLSHELRTPLNGIVVMTRMLRDQRDTFTPKLQGYIDILSQCSLQMLEWINDILDYSKLASHRFKLNPANMSLETVVEQSMSVGGSLAQAKGVNVRKVFHSEVPKLVRADAKRIQQILVNLLANAVKFTDRGEVVLEVDAQKVDSESDDGPIVWSIEMRVIDQGCGVSLGDRERIFEVFSHAELHPVEMVHRQGTGLGLAIARNLARLMGGDIHVTANEPPRKGSTFVVSLTLREELDIQAMLDMYVERLNGKNVLIVDDKEDNRIYLANLAFQWRLNPTIFSSATEALLYVENRKEKSIYDIYWIDIHMAGLNGIELAQRLRQLFGDTIPIIGLSSVGLEVHGKQVFDVFETKPVDNYSLLAHTTRLLFPPAPAPVVAATTTSRKRRHSVSGASLTTTTHKFKTLSDSESEPTVTGAITNGEGARRRISPRSSCDRFAGSAIETKPFIIYAVEDDAFNREILNTLIEKVAECENIVLSLFETGEAIVSQVEQRMPHACLIDLKLSTSLTGYDVVKLIREQSQRTNRQLPTMIAVTASVLDSDRQQCSVNGFDFYISKPIDVDYFWSLISTIIHRWKK